MKKPTDMKVNDEDNLEWLKQFSPWVACSMDAAVAAMPDQEPRLLELKTRLRWRTGVTTQSSQVSV